MATPVYQPNKKNPLREDNRRPANKKTRYGQSKRVLNEKQRG
jgi:hypothetical protein